MTLTEASKLLALAVTLGSLPQALVAQDFAGTRSTLEQWVNARRSIATTENNWRVDRETIAHSIELLQAEAELLEKQITEAEERLSAADKQRAEVAAENDTLRTAANVVNEAITGLENEVRSLTTLFPAPLARQIDPLITRMPRPGATGQQRVGSSTRLQNVLGILQEAEKFNNSILVARETQRLPSGQNAEVQTLYVGLAQAYFVDGSGSYAGILRPSANGWVATSAPELAGAIASALAVYHGERLAEFVALPVEIN
jgi:prophage DNA circulation protein